MEPFLSDRRILEACKRYNVKRLHVFGSFASGNASAKSDVDFLVEFERDSYIGAFDQFMGFKDRLEQIIDRPVDLLTTKRFRNVLFQEEVERTKKLVYAA